MLCLTPLLRYKAGHNLIKRGSGGSEIAASKKKSFSQDCKAQIFWRQKVAGNQDRGAQRSKPCDQVACCI